MAASATFRPIKVGDVSHVAARLRVADQDELRAALGTDDFERVIAFSVGTSLQGQTMQAPDGEPIAVMGLTPISLLSGVGSPWMLGTERTYSFPGALVREGRRYIQDMRRLCPYLVNYVDARNVLSIRYLSRLGFAIRDAQPFGAAGLPFHRFELGG